MAEIVRLTKFQRSPLPQGGLEILINLIVKQGDVSKDNGKMEKLISTVYMEPENIPIIADEHDNIFM